jgi:hypothetical protein
MLNHPALILAVALSASAHAQTATVTLEGDWFLQAGQVVSDRDLAAFSYGTGQPLPGRAIFQTYLSDGTEEAPLLDGTERYSRHTWYFDQPTKMFTFSGLDLDRVGLTDDQLDATGESLAGAYVELTWVDGFYARLPLSTTAWSVTQVLNYPQVSSVPELGSLVLMLAGLGVLAWVRKNVCHF